MLGGLGVVAGAVAGVALVLTTTSLPTGLFQRLGLTAGDIWIATSALVIAAGRIRVAHLGGRGMGEARGPIV